MTVTFKDYGMAIYQNEILIYTGERAGYTLYHLHASPIAIGNETAAIADLDIRHSIPVGHRRIGHVNIRTLRRMCIKGIVKGLLLSDLTDVGNHPPLCTGCAKGKMHRISFPAGRRSTCLIGEIIHSDVCGPMSYTSINHERYFVIFKDDFSGFMAIYFMKKKSETFSFYRLFAALIKNQTGLNILTLRSDGGGEFESNEFNNHLKEKGVIHERSCPDTPSQNGCAERSHRTVMESARSMLHSSNAPLWLWNEAVRYAVYILNRVPSKEKLRTPIEIIYKTKPDVSNIREFGVLVFILCPDKDRKKIDEKSLSGMLVGFDETQKGYRVYVPSKKRIIVTAHVRIDENTMFNYKMENPVTSSLIVSSTDPFMTEDQVHNLIIHFNTQLVKHSN